MTADQTPPSPASRRMTDLPTDDRPRERLLRLGGEAMTDAELVAILLRTGVKGHNVAELAREFVESLGVEGLTALRNYGHDELRALVRRQEHDLRGIGDDKIATLLAALEFGARVFGPAPRELGKPILVASDVVRHFFGEQTRCVREGFWLLALDHRRALIGRKPALLTTDHRRPQPSLRRRHAQPAGHRDHPRPHPRRADPRPPAPRPRHPGPPRHPPALLLPPSLRLLRLPLTGPRRRGAPLSEDRRPIHFDSAADPPRISRRSKVIDNPASR